MTWRIGIEHVSRYRYLEPVTTSFNEARIVPSTRQGQTVIESGVDIKPHTHLFTYFDYWSTLVVAFDVSVPHTELVVTGWSTVETASSNGENGHLGWEGLHSYDIQDRFAELLIPTRFTEGNEELTSIAHDLAAGRAPRETLEEVAAWTRSTMRYVAGSTNVSTSALEAWRQSAGVCQDFAHLTLAILRSLGIPARYVSGYLHPNPDALVGEPTDGQSHAWVEAWLGSWHAVDPTNGSSVGERHVAVGRGRDYADVAPFRGVYHGGALGDLSVSVKLTRVA